jgi:beta-hydroxylase
MHSARRRGRSGKGLPDMIASDPYAGSLRYHLGLVTPNADTCKISIDGEPYYWKDGEDVLFDETFIHYAENKSDVTRLILFCDVERPMKVGLMACFNRFMASTLVRASKTQNVDDGLLYWMFLS